MIDAMTLMRLARPALDRQARAKRKAMEPFLERYAASMPEKDRSAIKPISGTFIYHRPPDYAGVPAMDWDGEAWLAEFRRLRDLGIDTVIYQGAVGEILSGEWFVYYPVNDEKASYLSSIQRRLKRPPRVEPGLGAMLDAAEEAGMAVHLGLYNVMRGWFGITSRAFVERVLTEEIAVARELVRLYGSHPALAGWYVSPEIMYLAHGSSRRLDMHSFLSRLTEPLLEAERRLEIGLSPGSLWRPGSMEKIEAFWIKALSGSGVSILYPQDSVGVLTVRPEDASGVWRSWKRIAAESGVRLWANCESFERVHYGPQEPLAASPFPRLLSQLESASPSVEKIVTWEAMYFMREGGARGGTELESSYRNYFMAMGACVK